VAGRSDLTATRQAGGDRADTSRSMAVQKPLFGHPARQDLGRGLLALAELWANSAAQADQLDL